MSLRRRTLEGESMGNAIQIGNNKYPLSLEAMFYALENGTGATGTFTFDTALPNTETLIVETGLSKINGLMFLADGYFENVLDSSSVQTTGFGIGTYSEGTLVKGIRVPRTHKAAAVTDNNNAEPAQPVIQGTIRIDGGDVYCTAKYNRNASYTPFEANVRYRWVAW